MFLFRAVFLLAFLGLALLMFGSQAGCLDGDGDRVPDIPVVVLASGPVGRASRAAAANSSYQIRSVSLDPSTLIHSTQPGHLACALAKVLSDSRSFYQLRC